MGKNSFKYFSVKIGSLKLMDARFLRYVMIKPVEVDKSIKSITQKSKVFFKEVYTSLSFSDHVSILFSIPSSKYFRGNG